MASANIDHLREHGPTAVEDLPVTSVPVSDRRDGVWAFKPMPPKHGVGSSGTSSWCAVYYLRNEHELEDVVAEWVAANPDAVERRPVSSLRRCLRGCGPEYHDAIDAVLPPEGHGGEGGHAPQTDALATRRALLDADPDTVRGDGE